MTLGGLMCTFIPTMVLVYYCPDLQSTAPTWVYVLNAAGIFIYQVDTVTLCVSECACHALAQPPARDVESPAPLHAPLQAQLPHCPCFYACRDTKYDAVLTSTQS